MRGERGVSRREMCVLTGMAVGFRSFFAVVVDGEGALNAGWISILLGAILALPVLAVPSAAAGRWGRRAACFLVMLTALYDCAASVRILCTAGRYMALSDASLPIVMAVTVLTGVVGVSMGPGATAGGAALWHKLAAGLVVLLVLAQASQLQPAWLTPVLGPGWFTLGRNALPVAGILTLAAPAGWLVDGEGGSRAMLKTALGAALISSLVAAALGMLSPALWEEMPQRAYRMEHLLVNDRAGLSLELPYVILIFGGMTTVMLFEMTLAVWAMRKTLPGLGQTAASGITGALVFILMLAGLGEKESVWRVSAWYYPAIGLPVLLSGASVFRRDWRERKARGKGD